MEQKTLKDKRSRPVYYSDSFKRELIEEHLRTGISKLEIQRKYGIRFKSAIITWMKALGYAGSKNVITFDAVNQFELAKKSASKNSSDLEGQIALLKRQLADERLRSKMYERMIEIAEQELKIPIRKKSNTK